MNGATIAFSYDVQGNLRDGTLTNGTVIKYLVDATGRRIGKRVTDWRRGRSWGVTA